MKRFIVSSVFALTAIFSVPGSAQSLSQNDSVQTRSPNLAADTADVQHVIDAYHQALVTHDGARLANLFLARGGMWLNVLSDGAFALQKAKNPAASKVRVGSYADLQSKCQHPRSASIRPIPTCNRTATVPLPRSISTSYSLRMGMKQIGEAKRGFWLKGATVGG